MKKALRLGICLGAIIYLAPCVASAQETARPNILWITSEDHGPHLGCYGDSFATTPNVDALAAQGLVYRHCWSNAPVCAPARTTLISGLYPPSTGAEHMRSMVAFPRGRPMFPQLLRKAGYYCTNNAKEDYNLSQPGQVWDESSKKAHWKKRAAGQPFFAVFNCEKSHESKLRVRPHAQVHSPTGVRLPAYHPDTPEVRQDWAQYYDTVTEADTIAGSRLRELREAGLADDTIVFYFADHGSGMPGNKRWPREAGLHVPLIVFIPDKFKSLRGPDYKPGGGSERLVSFVDFAPTVLSLAGLEPPAWMQGHAFLGKFQQPPQPLVYGFRGRMDERYDLVRCVSEGRFVYIRNFRPEKIYGQHLDYMWQTPTTRIWEQLYQQGKLNDAQAAFWKTKPAEELYDLSTDRDEVVNLAGQPQFAEKQKQLREALHQQMIDVCDVGLLPEGEIHRRSAGSTPYDMGHDPAKYPVQRILATAELASSLDPKSLPALTQALGDSDAAVRYWAVLGHLMRGSEAVRTNHARLLAALDDTSPDVRIAAAETIARWGNESELPRALALLKSLADWSQHDVFTALAALNAIDALGPMADPILEDVLRLPRRGPAPHARYAEYIPRLLEYLQERRKPAP
jgi:arylsulfatase A-like enzyme